MKPWEFFNLAALILAAPHVTGGWAVLLCSLCVLAAVVFRLIDVRINKTIDTPPKSRPY